MRTTHTTIAERLLEQALDAVPELDCEGRRFSLSDAGLGAFTLWEFDPATYEWCPVADVHLTVDVQQEVTA